MSFAKSGPFAFGTLTCDVDCAGKSATPAIARDASDTKTALPKRALSIVSYCGTKVGFPADFGMIDSSRYWNLFRIFVPDG
jgi:hypothetical protein